MSSKPKTTMERGRFKELIHSTLYNSNDIKELLLGDTSGMDIKTVREKFKEHCKSHLFVDDTILETDTFIFYDVVFPRLDPNIKDCRVIMYLICHRDILDNYFKDGYYGNRADILAQMVERAIVNDFNIANSFGIGRIALDSVDIYNAARFYGCVLTFNVPNFR